MRPRRLRAWMAPAILFIVLFALLEGVVGSGLVPEYVFPTPTSVFQSLWRDREELFAGFLGTGVAAAIGLALSAVIGLLVALTMALSRSLRGALEPYAVFFQTVPIVALAPVLVIWFGFGRPTVIASSFIVSVFPVIATATMGLHSIDRAWLDLFFLNRASRWVTLFKLRLPAAQPAIFSGLRVASGLAVIGAVVGEFIAGGGLGEVIDAARTQQRLDKVFAAVLLSSALGLLFVVAIDWLNHQRLRAWYGEERGR